MLSPLCVLFQQIGTVDLEINTLTKLLFLAVLILSLLMMILKVLHVQWVQGGRRYLVLFVGVALAQKGEERGGRGGGTCGR